MLVYTLENYVQNPEPDPEVWPYLENLVNVEDKVFEEEFKKTKNDKVTLSLLKKRISNRREFLLVLGTHLNFVMVCLKQGLRK